MSLPKVLVVDDREANLVAVRTMLEPLGAEVVAVQSGEDALASLMKHSFALILLDVEMPGLDGFETAALIREDEEYSGIPIIFLTAHTDSEELQFRGYAAGAVDYLTKPLRRGVLTGKVKVFLRLYQQRRELEASRAAFRDFAHSASHDLRAPARQVGGFADLLARTASDRLTEAEQGYVRSIQQASARMHALCEGLLSYAKVGADTRAFERVDLRGIALGVQQDLGNVIRQSAGAVDVGACGEVHGDSALLYQLMLNLVGNGLKYRKPDAPPRVEVRGEQVGNTYRLTVEDNGIGFEPSQAERMFQPFGRLVSPGEYEGSGIGLATVKKIVELHGAQITAEGVPGHGARFTVEFPLPESMRARPGPVRARLLLVDDDENDLMLATLALRDEFEVITARSAEQALELLKGGSFEVVLSDFDMPGMNGLELLEQVRHVQPRARRLLTSSGSPPGVQAALEARTVERFLPKAVSADELHRVLRAA